MRKMKTVKKSATKLHGAGKLVWPADNVVRRAVAELVPSARNARQHSDGQIDQIARSIRKWGWTVPVLVDETGAIIAGHGRVLAAARLRIDTVPVVVAKGWTKTKQRAYMLADNKLALNANWDEGLLRIELSELGEADFTDAGFSEADIAQLMTPVDPGAAWDQTMPAFNQGDVAVKHLMVHFEKEADVQKFAQLVRQKITLKTKFIWYPRQPAVKTAGKRWVEPKQKK
jgi:hypothetical protein